MADSPVFDARETIAGVSGAVCHVYFGLPLDTVKVRLQTGGLPPQTSTIGGFVQIVRQEGVAALYKGGTPALGSAFAEYSVLFTVNDAIRRRISRAAGYADAAELPLAWQAIAGGCSGLFSGAAMGAPELIKCRLQASVAQVSSGGAQVPAAEAGPIGAAIAIVREQGVAGLFRGTTSTMVRESPFNFVLFGAYETASAAMASSGITERLGSSTQSIIAGGIAGTCAWATILPIDYVKSTISTTNTTKSPFAVFSEVVRTKGLRHMYVGFGAVSARAFAANAGVFWGYEQTKKLLAKF
jgi:solute carrier family 25 carnitine/acylcarnitine transporter 20/29